MEAFDCLFTLPWKQPTCLPVVVLGGRSSVEGQVEVESQEDDGDEDEDERVDGDHFVSEGIFSGHGSVAGECNSRTTYILHQVCEL